MASLDVTELWQFHMHALLQLSGTVEKKPRPQLWIHGLKPYDSSSRLPYCGIAYHSNPFISTRANGLFLDWGRPREPDPSSCVLTERGDGGEPESGQLSQPDTELGYRGEWRKTTLPWSAGREWLPGWWIPLPAAKAYRSGRPCMRPKARDNPPSSVFPTLTLHILFAQILSFPQKSACVPARNWKIKSEENWESESNQPSCQCLFLEN